MPRARERTSARSAGAHGAGGALRGPPATPPRMSRILERGDDGYEAALEALARRGAEDLSRVEPEVRAILAAVRDRGDEALRELTERFERGLREYTYLSRDD